MPEPIRSGGRIALLLGLGVLAVASWDWLDLYDLPFLVRSQLMLWVVGIVATVLEVAESRRTGRRWWVLSWLPLVLGMAGFLLLATVLDGSANAPDAGLAMSILIAAVLGASVAFAVAVLGISTLVLWALRRRDGRNGREHDDPDVDLRDL